MIKKGEDPGSFMPIAQTDEQVSTATSYSRIERERNKGMVTAREGDPFAGPADAEHEIVVFVDYGCPYCKLAHPAIRDLIRTHPEIKISIRDFPVLELHPNAKIAAQAARCIWNQGHAEAYWRYVDLLYTKQEQQDASTLRTIAGQVGANLSAYDKCIRTAETNAAVGQSIMDAETAGVKGTPTFFVDGLKLEGVYEAGEILRYLNL